MTDEEALAAFQNWYESQKHGKVPVPKGTIAGALVVLDRLKRNYDLDLEKHLTPGGAQVKGASGENINEGFRPYILVPYDRLVGVRQNIEGSSLGRGKIAVESIESFVSQNVEELSGFATHELANTLYQLLTEYNSRIDAAEADKSLLVEIPRNLQG